MSLRQNAIDNSHDYPLAAKAVEESFYVDDGLIGADNIERQSYYKNNSTIYSHVENSYSVNGTPTKQPCLNKSVNKYTPFPM